MRHLLSASVLLVLALAVGSAEPSGTGVTADSVLIGLEGPANSFSLDEENLGMLLVARHVNDHGGVGGRKLLLRSYPRSGAAAIAEAVTNAKRLVEQDGVFLLYGFGGPASVEIGPYAMAQKVPYLFPHTALLTNDADRYVFTSYPRYLGESQVMLRYLAQTRGLKRIGIVHDENVYGRYFLDRLNEYADRFGYTVAGAQAVHEREPADLHAELKALQAHAPDAVVMALYPGQARRLMEAKAALGWKTVTMVSSGPLTDEQYLNVPGGFSEGTLGFCYYPDPNNSNEPGVVEYRKSMEIYYPGHPLNRYSLYGYVFSRLIVEGLLRAGPDLTRERFIDAMESIANWESGGIMPAVTFSKTNHHAQRAGFICELRAQRFQALSGWLQP